MALHVDVETRKQHIVSSSPGSLVAVDSADYDEVRRSFLTSHMQKLTAHIAYHFSCASGNAWLSLIRQGTTVASRYTTH